MTVLEALNGAVATLNSAVPEDLTFNLHLVVKDENSYTISLASKEATVTEGLTGTPDAKIFIKSDILFSTLAGKLSPKMLVFNPNIQVNNAGSLKAVLKWFDF